MILTRQEWLSQSSGIKGTRVRTYNDASNLVEIEYILLDDEDYESDIEQMKSVAPGYLTDTVNVTLK